MKNREEKHLCDSCVNDVPTCVADKIVWGIDRHPEAKGKDADKVLECDKYRKIRPEPIFGDEEGGYDISGRGRG